MHFTRRLERDNRRGSYIATVVAIVAGCTFATTTNAVAGPAVPTAQNSVLGVSVDPSGWIHYSNVLANSLDLQAAVNTTESGKKGTNGACVFSSASTADTKSAGYSEETAYNPKTCQMIVRSGGLTAAGAAKLEALTPKTSGAAQVSRQVGAPAVRSTKVAVPSTKPATTAALGTYSAFEKASYVDPAIVTITSVTTNLFWQATGGRVVNPSGNAVPYAFSWDGWSSSGVSFKWSGSPTTQLQSFDTFHNTDFEKVVVGLLGVAGYAACGWNGSAANFYLAPWVNGIASGYYNWGHSNSVSGGCSDLVHFRENHGGGSSS
ncbi:hypothetical protein SAMN05444157_3360 [Frankineae bacterium MT45]|nr:hypothetical protein SAMN05444157_3360 [Frankineae bacterium MT45]